MKSYVPHTQDERREMLNAVGVTSYDELYADVPQDLRLKAPLDLPKAMSESEIRRHFAALCNDVQQNMACFRGCGAYNHFIPAAVSQLAARSEFYTAYTPYQAEMSQGMLQAIFEYQTLICQLTGLDASNASVYDGATAAVEAMHMLRDAKRKSKVLVSRGLHPEVLETLRTYARFSKIELVEVPLCDDCGVTDIDFLKNNAEGAAGFIAAQPNFLGCLEDMSALSDVTHGFGGLFVSYVNPISLGILARPAEYGADIAVGDGQPLGIPMNFGGPYVGFMACTQKLCRNLPGRIAGQTMDAEGTRTFVLTLQAREQHIRRDKAASNICSNQMLCAITASIYLSLMGKEGLRNVAMQCAQKARYFADGIARIKGAKLTYPNTPFFNEICVSYPSHLAEDINNALKSVGIMGGMPVSRLVEDRSYSAIWCLTELNTREEIDAALLALEEVLK